MTLTGDSALTDSGFDRPPDDPLTLYADWLDQALRLGVGEPHALVLSTATPEGEPSSRVVLLKGCDGIGFLFATSAASEKGRLLDRNPRAASTLWWRETLQQIHIVGSVERLSPEASDEMFADRTVEAQAVSTISRQSEILDDEDELERRVQELVQSNSALPRPSEWFVYRLVPSQVEFWHGRANRLHRRLRYERAGDGWRTVRLQP